MSDTTQTNPLTKRAMLIINPVSGKRMVLRYVPQIIRILMDAGYLVTSLVTSRRGEATEFVRSLGRDLDLICCTGGMSVDPDDRPPGAIRDSGAQIVTYGAPTLPGAMLCLGYFEEGKPVIGLPGCVMYAKATVFDLILPRIAAGVKINRKDIISMGHGGLCLGCRECRYPLCSFGKGV